MLTVEEYLDRVVALATPLPSEPCPVGSGFGRVLDEDVVARFAVPPFDNSAMDGFAVRAADVTAGPTRLRVVGDIPAGAASAPTVGAGEAARIMTGAPMPPGADAVVMVEDTDQEQGDVPLPESVAVVPVAAGKNVRRAGEDVAVGDLVLRAGERWTPAAAGAASSIGYATVRLRRRPKVAVLATGTELVAPGEPIGFGQIPDSNSVLIAGLVERFGGEVVCARAVSDDVEDFRAALAEAAEADVIVTSGGVSVGAFEVVRQVVEGDIEFVKVAMQPGKPQACGEPPHRGRPRAGAARAARQPRQRVRLRVGIPAPAARRLRGRGLGVGLHPGRRRGGLEDAARAAPVRPRRPDRRRRPPGPPPGLGLAPCRLAALGRGPRRRPRRRRGSGARRRPRRVSG